MSARWKRVSNLAARCAIIGLLSVPAPVRAAAKRVAVLEFQAAWSGECSGTKVRGDAAERCELLGLLTDEARTGALDVLRTPAFLVMTRENTALLLREMGSKQACTEGECEVETAKLIGANLVISGQVSAVEGQWLASVRLHDVDTAALLGTAKARGRAKLDVLDGLRREVELMVRKAADSSISAGRATSGAPAMSEGKFGETAPALGFAPDAESVVVGFDSEPAGASVRLDGHLLCDAAPCRKKVVAGSHEATFEKERYDQATRVFTATKGAAVKGTLAPRFGWLSVETAPAGLTVTIDGADAGRSPVASMEVDQGPVEVAVTDPCYLKVGERLVMKAGERRVVKIQAKARMAGLKVEAEDEKANAVEGVVKVDGEEVGAIGTTLTVPLCSRAAALTHGTATWEQVLTLKEGRLTEIRATLRETRPFAAPRGDPAREPARKGGTRTSSGAFRIGVVTFLSGAAASDFGVPARNGAEVLAEALNGGKAPAPYAKAGIGGRQIELVFLDEAGGTTKQVSEFRDLVQRQKVDAVIGYISSGDCLAVAPVAEELKALTIFFDCGTPRIFEDGSYKYVFRTSSHAAMDNVAAALYVTEMMPKAKKIAGINQNYAWGQDSWNDFEASMKVLRPGVEVTTSQMPKLLAGQYGAEISALMAGSPDVIHSSFWGGEMASHELGGQIPDGTMIGARGPHGAYAPDNELNRFYRSTYQARFVLSPNYPAYHMAQSILGLKAAYERAQGAGAAAPTQDQIIAAFEGLTFETPSGTIKMTLGKGHQAIEETVYGQAKMVKGKLALVNVKRYPADKVNPPEGVKSIDWIKAGFQAPK